MYEKKDPCEQKETKGCTSCPVLNYATDCTTILSLFNAKNSAYWERNQLIVFLTKCFPSYLAKHKEDDEWQKDWQNIVFVDTPEGQLSWHIHTKQLELFSHLEYKENNWDGHKTQEKYTRLSLLDSPVGDSEASWRCKDESIN